MIGQEVFGKIFGPRRDEVRMEFRILCNEELCNQYRSSSAVRAVNCRQLRHTGNSALLRNFG
jgi:hypothetical protein